MIRTSFVLVAGFLAALVSVSCSEDTGAVDDGPNGGTAGGSSGAAGSATGGKGGAAGSSGSGGASSGRGGSSNAGATSAGTGGTNGKAGAGSGGSSAGTGGGKGGTSSGGKSGVAGEGGRGGQAGTDASGGAPEAGAPGEAGAPSTGGGCAGRNLLLCEDFETTDVGDVPDGWERHGSLANVADDEAHGGDRSLKLGAAANSERRIYHDARLLGSAHWGRIFYKVDLPVPDAFVHATMVSLIGDGPENGRSDYRPIDTIKQAVDTRDVGGKHNFIFNVQIIGSSEFGTETNYVYDFDGEWHCAEYHIQASNQSYELFLDGESILDIENGPGNYDDTDIPDEFEELRVGWINYQNAPPGFTAWIDDIAFDDQRIGCE